MSKQGSHIDLPALSGDESLQSSGYSTSINDNKAIQQQTSNIQPIKSYSQHLNPNIQLQGQQQQQTSSFMDPSFFYNLDQMTNENSLYFMQQQQQQQQQQNSLFDHFMKNNTNNNNNASSSALSITTSMESFQNAVTTSVGEQPPSFWAGLNNVI
jgi:hypothetical protein